MNDIKKAATKFIAEINEAELACRLLEAAAQLKRPIGKNAVLCLAELDPVDREAWRRAARAAMEYWRQCIQQGQSVS